MMTGGRPWIGLAAALLCAGCAALPTPPMPTLPLRRRPAPPPAAATHPSLEGLQDVRGAMELHSRHSHDGTMAISAIAKLAQAANLDFIIVTDHNHLNGKSEERRQGRPMVLVGSELSTTGGHLLALFIEKPVTNDQPVEQMIEAIHAQGGLAIVSDPASKKKPWTRWDLPIDGMAIFDLNNALMDDTIPWMLVKATALPNPMFWQTVRRRPGTASSRSGTRSFSAAGT